MALISCPECGNQVSDQTKVCPQCGYPIAKSIKHSAQIKKTEQIKNSLNSKRTKTIFIIFIAIVALSIVGMLVAKNICFKHEYKWVITSKATCSIEGERVQVCNLCGKHGKTEKTAVINHKYNWKEVTHADCQHTGEKIQICSVCGAEGESKEIPLAEHKLIQTVITKPTCTEIGSARDECSVCGLINEYELPASGHNYTDATCTEPSKCSNCGEIVGEPLGHEYKNGICERCGEQKIYGLHDTFIAYNDNGEALELVFDSAKRHYACNPFWNDMYGINANAPVVVLTYSYKNVNCSDKVNIGIVSLNAYDEQGEAGSMYGCVTHNTYAKECPKGMKCSGATIAFLLNNSSSKVTVSFSYWISDNTKAEATFLLDVS